MIKEEWKEKYDENLLIEAELKSVWGSLICLDVSNNKIFTLAKSVLFKLEYAHYHLIQALRNSELALKEINYVPNAKKEYFEFVTNCNFDAMIYALNSVVDIIAKLLIEVYSEIYSDVNPNKIYFYNLNNPKFLKPLKEIDSATADIIHVIYNMPERTWVNEYCNQNKHEKTFFSAGVNWFFDKNKEEILYTYNLKNRYRDDGTDKNLNEYAPVLFNAHIEKICELGKAILNFKNIKYQEIDENLLKQVDMSSIRYYR